MADEVALLKQLQKETSEASDELEALLDGQGESGGGPIPQRVEDSARGIIVKLRSIADAVPAPTPPAPPQTPPPSTEEIKSKPADKPSA